MKTKKLSVTDKIARLLLSGRTITQVQAGKQFMCGRLAPRINELRKQGWGIETLRYKTETGATAGKYKLISHPTN